MIAERKGYAYGPSFALGLVFGIFAVIISLCLKPKDYSAAVINGDHAARDQGGGWVILCAVIAALIAGYVWIVAGS